MHVMERDLFFPISTRKSHEVIHELSQMQYTL